MLITYTDNQGNEVKEDCYLKMDKENQLFKVYKTETEQYVGDLTFVDLFKQVPAEYLVKFINEYQNQKGTDKT